MKFLSAGSFFRVFTLFALLAAMFGSLVMVTPVRAGGIAVNNSDDVVADDGACTLREAILSANTDKASGAKDGECSAGSGADIITLEATTYSLTIAGPSPASGGVHIWIVEPLTIIGLGEGSTTIKSAYGNAGIFYVSGTTLNLSSLTMADGNTVAGGAIHNANYGTLTVTNTTFVGNSAGDGGAIYNSLGSNAMVTNSTFSGNISRGSGGAIYNGSGTTTLTGSTFSDNSAGGGQYVGAGGAIMNSSTMNITNCVLTGNRANTGGAITNGQNAPLTIKNSTLSGNSADKDAFGNGGAIQNFGTLNLINSTLSGNIAGGASGVGGGITNDYYGTLTIINSTLSGNSAAFGGGIRTDGTVNYTNTIIANSSSGGDCSRVYGNFSTKVNNLVEDGSCFATISGDPNLGPLADNGGPTLTHALLPGSRAINMGSDTACAASPVFNIDQRSGVRPQGAHCDIGAVESGLDSPAPVVFSSARNGPSPTLQANVAFIVTFSTTVTGVDLSDFSLATTGLSGVTPTAIFGSGSVYTVIVSTGSGSGTLRLDVIDDNSVQDLALTPLAGAGAGNGNYTAGETYDVRLFRIDLPLVIK